MLFHSQRNFGDELRRYPIIFGKLPEIIEEYELLRRATYAKQFLFPIYKSRQSLHVLEQNAAKDQDIFVIKLNSGYEDAGRCLW
jgi:hypothetical protein